MPAAQKLTPSTHKVHGAIYKFTRNAKRNVHAMSDAKLAAIANCLPRNADQRVLWCKVQAERCDRLPVGSPSTARACSPSAR
jgi:hypothetical protein